MRYMYYCVKCGFLGSDEGDNVVNQCPECRHILHSTHIPKDLWQKKNNQEKERLKREWEQAAEESRNSISDFRCTSTESFSDITIKSYLGFITGESSYATNGSLGGIVTCQEERFENAFSIAMENLREKAYLLGANAIIGMRVSTTAITHEQHVLVVVSGTAVRI